MNKLRPALCLSVLVLGAFGLVACGDDGGDSETTTSQSESTEPSGTTGAAGANGADGGPNQAVAVAQKLKDAGLDFAYSITPTDSDSAATAFKDADVSIDTDTKGYGGSEEGPGLVPATGGNPAALFDLQCKDIFVRIGTGDSANGAENEAVVTQRADEVQVALDELYGPC